MAVGKTTGEAVVRAAQKGSLDDIVRLLKRGMSSGEDVPTSVRRTAMEMRGQNPADWRMSHRPSDPDFGAPFSRLGDIYPEDVYTRPQIYAHSPEEIAIARMAKDMRGQDDAMMDIYRAAPRWVSNIEEGDWVTPSLSYARIHARGNVQRPDVPTVILRGRVPARTVISPADSLSEYGYFGAPIAPAVRMGAPRIPRSVVQRASNYDEEALQEIVRLYGLDRIPRQGM